MNSYAFAAHDLAHPFGLSLYGNYIFWSDWKTMSIYMADKNTGIGRQQLVQGLKGLMDVRVFHRRKFNASFENPCEQRNGGCSHLCLLKPKGYSCACPTSLMLQVSQFIIISFLTLNCFVCFKRTIRKNAEVLPKNGS